MAIEEEFVDYDQRGIHLPLEYPTPFEYLEGWKKGVVAAEEAKAKG
jgi:hypothetical protein